jgi:hypothetical protein
MKRIITSALLIMFIGCASFGTTIVAEGKSFTPLGNFRIVTAEQPVILNGIQLETYLISYDKSDIKVTVAINKTKNCKRYITMTEQLSVQYVCRSKYFGVEKLGEENAVNGITTSDSELNRFAYFHQKIITHGNNDIITCMKLIGAYFPELLKTTDIA